MLEKAARDLGRALPQRLAFWISTPRLEMGNFLMMGSSGLFSSPGPDGQQLRVPYSLLFRLLRGLGDVNYKEGLTIISSATG